MRLVAVRVASATAAAHVIESGWEAGNAVAPLDPSLPELRTRDLLRSLRPAAIVHEGPGGVGTQTTALDGAREVPDGTAAVVTTSGSTGQARPVVLSQAAMDASARASLQRLRSTAPDRWLLTLPLHHAAGLQVLRRSDVLGTRPEILERFDVQDVAASSAAWWALVPTMLVRLLDAGVDLTGRGILVGGAGASAALLDRARAGGARVVTSYGMTETCGGCVYDGEPIGATEIAVRPDGRIALRGPTVATGVLTDVGVEPLVDPDGWFVTSDRGVMEAGRLRVLGRADAVIVTGGENVAAEAVEQCLREHPSVADAGVLGEPDTEWGQRVVALVVPTHPDEDLDTNTLRAHVQDRLGRVAAPREIHAVAFLPKTALGKLRRGDLAATLERVANRSVPG